MHLRNRLRNHNFVATLFMLAVIAMMILGFTLSHT